MCSLKDCPTLPGKNVKLQKQQKKLIKKIQKLLKLKNNTNLDQIRNRKMLYKLLDEMYNKNIVKV